MSMLHAVFASGVALIKERPTTADSQPGFARSNSGSLEENLLFLSKFGRPRLSQMDGNWYCVVSVFITATGASMDVATDFKQQTPMSAVLMCRERLETALKGLGVDVSK